MDKKASSISLKSPVSRREFLAATSAGLAVTAAAATATADTVLRTTAKEKKGSPTKTAPFDTLREYVKALEERGEKSVPISLVVGQDPMIWLVSGSRIPERRGKKPVDELATAGGLRGKAVEIVK